MVTESKAAQYKKQVDFRHTLVTAGGNPIEFDMQAIIRINRGNCKPVVYVDRFAAVYYTGIGAKILDSEDLKQGLVQLDYEPTGNIEVKNPQSDFILKFDPFTWATLYEDEYLFEIKQVILDRLWGFAQDLLALKHNLSFI